MGFARTLARLEAPSALQAAARSALFYAGWLAQAQLGMALSWGWFGGLGGVALWWAALAWLAHRWPALALRRPVLLALAGVASGGLALAMAAEWMPLRLVGWLAGNLAWATLCHQLQRSMAAQPPWWRRLWLVATSKTRFAAPTGAGGDQLLPALGPGLACALGHLAGLLASVWLAAQAQHWALHWPLLCGLLLLSPWLQGQAQGNCSQVHRLDAPTGLMMGSLLPMAQWCSALGWTAAESISWHVLAMWLGWALGTSAASGFKRTPVHPTKLMCGAWALAAVLAMWASPWTMLAAAGLVGAASAAHRAAPRPSDALGVLLLLWVGQLSVSQGPDALRMVLVLTLLWSICRVCWPISRKPPVWQVRAS
jgi:hypothetical protein